VVVLERCIAVLRRVNFAALTPGTTAALRVRLAARAVTCLLFAACTGDRAVPSPSSTARRPADSSREAADSMVWLTRERTMDFTDDGVPDTVRLRALGRTADSLRIALTFRSAGAERWREEWASEYELAVAPSFDTDSARAAFVRDRLDRALASVVVEPFDLADYTTMAQPVDSAVLRNPPWQQVSFAFGFETTVVLARDPAAGTLRRLHACC
jgi:hypothetical protein